MKKDQIRKLRSGEFRRKSNCVFLEDECKGVSKKREESIMSNAGYMSSKTRIENLTFRFSNMEVIGDSFKQILSLPLWGGGEQMPDYNGKRKIEKGKVKTQVLKTLQSFN